METDLRELLVMLRIMPIVIICFLFFSCSDIRNEIAYSYSINYGSKEKTKLIEITLKHPRQKRGIRYFKITNNQISEEIKFYDDGGEEVLSYPIIIPLNAKPIKVNFDDSLHIYLGQNVPFQHRFEYRGKQRRDGFTLITKTGIDPNMDVERYLFDENYDLIDVHF